MCATVYMCVHKEQGNCFFGTINNPGTTIPGQRHKSEPGRAGCPASQGGKEGRHPGNYKFVSRVLLPPGWQCGPSVMALADGHDFAISRRSDCCTLWTEPAAFLPPAFNSFNIFTIPKVQRMSWIFHNQDRGKTVSLCTMF